MYGPPQAPPPSPKPGFLAQRVVAPAACKSPVQCIAVHCTALHCTAFATALHCTAVWGGNTRCVYTLQGRPRYTTLGISVSSRMILLL
jgi:hypothetical protein